MASTLLASTCGSQRLQSAIILLGLTRRVLLLPGPAGVLAQTRPGLEAGLESSQLGHGAAAEPPQPLSWAGRKLPSNFVYSTSQQARCRKLPETVIDSDDPDTVHCDPARAVWAPGVGSFWWHTVKIRKLQNSNVSLLLEKLSRVHCSLKCVNIRMESISRHLDNDEKSQNADHNDADVKISLDFDNLFIKIFKPSDPADDSGATSHKIDLSTTFVEKRWDEFRQVEDPNRKVPEQHVSGLDLPAPATHLRSKSSRPNLA